MELLDSLCIYAMIMAARARDNVKEFFESQDGVSNVVATIIVLLITVLLIGVFWEQLQTWIKGIMDIIFKSKFDSSGLGGN